MFVVKHLHCCVRAVHSRNFAYKVWLTKGLQLLYLMIGDALLLIVRILLNQFHICVLKDLVKYGFKCSIVTWYLRILLRNI